MTLRRALILLRLTEFEASMLLKKYPEIVGEDVHDMLDKEITDEQYFDLFIACRDNNLDKRPSFIHGHCFNFRIKKYTDRGPSSFGYLNHFLDDVNTKDIRVSKTNVNNKIKIRIGMILQCFKEDSFGLLIAKRNNICGNEYVKDNRLFYFDKEEDSFLPRYALVAYVEDLENPNKAYHVIELSEFENAENDIVTTNGIPYIAESSSYNLIGIPHICKQKEIQYFYNIFFDIYIYHNYLYLNALNRLILPDCYEKKKRMDSIKQYVNKFDFGAVIDTFVSKDYGYLQHHRGSDDSFNTISYRIIDSSDSYILSIIPHGLDERYSLGSFDDKNYSITNSEEMASVIAKAKTIYSKDRHFGFLKKRYEAAIAYVRHERAIAQLNIESEFDIHESLCKLISLECDEIENIVKKYNSQL